VSPSCRAVAESRVAPRGLSTGYLAVPVSGGSGCWSGALLQSNRVDVDVYATSMCSRMGRYWGWAGGRWKWQMGSVVVVLTAGLGPWVPVSETRTRTRSQISKCFQLYAVVTTKESVIVSDLLPPHIVGP
jgi:hypothetical protein